MYIAYADHNKNRDYSIFTGFWYGSRGAFIVEFWPQHVITEGKPCAVRVRIDLIPAFLRRVHTALAARAFALFGVTTDGAARSPEPRRAVCGEVPHHSGTWHSVAEVVQAVLGAGARARQRLAATQPTVPTGRPSTKAVKAAARKNKPLAQQRTDWYHHR